MIQKEFGLVLPDKTVAWREYRGHPLDTPEQRAALVLVLRKTAEEIGFEEGLFLSFYRWSVRHVSITVDDNTWCIDSDEICTAPEDSAEN